MFSTLFNRIEDDQLVANSTSTNLTTLPQSNTKSVYMPANPLLWVCGGNEGSCNGVHSHKVGENKKRKKYIDNESGRDIQESAGMIG